MLDNPAPTRDRLAALLWSDRSEKQGKGSLRQALSTLRTALRTNGAPDLVTANDQVLLPDEYVTCDVLEFKAFSELETESALKQARSLYRGPFLDAVRLPDPAFGAWVADQRALYAQMAGMVGGRLGRLQKADERFAEAIDTMLWVLSLDPVREDVHRELMELYALAGNTTMALRQYQQCVELLRKELEVTPEKETTELYVKISENRTMPRQGLRENMPGNGAAATTMRRSALPEQFSVSSTKDQPGRISNLPLVAVLPFEVISESGELPHLAKGLFEDITTDLPRFHQVQTKTRNATLSALQSDTPRNDIGSATGADYVVDGAIRAAGDRVRVNAQLVDARSGLQIWSERYTADLKDLFETQDYLTQHIISGVTTRLKSEILVKAKRKPIAEATAYDLWLQGYALLQSGEQDDAIRARHFFQSAVDLDPFYARGFCGLSLSYFNEWGARAWHDWENAMKHAFDYAEQAVRLDETDNVGHCLLGRIHLFQQEYERGQRHLERAYTLNPHGPDMLATTAYCWCFLGDHGHARTLMERAIDLHPSPPDWYYASLALMHLMSGDDTEAHANFQKAPNAYIDTQLFLAAGHFEHGQDDLAQACIQAFKLQFHKKVSLNKPSNIEEMRNWLHHANPFRLGADRNKLEQVINIAKLDIE